MITTPLPKHADIVIIGGGIIGCSTAYHLAKNHKANIVLLERDRLTSGSTWHAAGLVGQLRSSASITQLLKYSVELYKNLDQETGLNTGWKMTGCLRLATNAERWIEYKRLATTAQSFGLEMSLIIPDEVKSMWPLLNTKDLIGASWLPTDGQANPSDIAQSLAKGARMHGAQIIENIRVKHFEIVENWIKKISTTSGDITCEKVVVCAGQWTRQIAELAGVSVPLQPVKHQYIITEAIEGVHADLPTLRDPDKRTYYKEEVGGLVMGGYEPNPIPWITDNLPDDFAFQLFDDDWGHFEQHMTAAIERIPALEKTGIKKMINGAESFTPDGNFILGRAPERNNLYVGAGFNAFGIASAGGAGWVLADWVHAGKAPMDLWVADIRRFSEHHRDKHWTCERTLEAYGKHYSIAFPQEEYDSGRPLLTSPLYSRLKELGAVLGSKLGWERANWFAPEGIEPKDVYSMTSPNWTPYVAAEHKATRVRVALFDQTSFAKFELHGLDAKALLDRLCANDVRVPEGRGVYTQMLNARGGIECDVTVMHLENGYYRIITGTGFRTHDKSWIHDHLRECIKNVGVTFKDVTEDYSVLAFMGPKSRDILQSLSNISLANDDLPFGHIKRVKIAGHDVDLYRVTYVGELGFELHCSIRDTAAIFDALMRADKEKNIKLAGYRAIESLRLEKFYRAWGTDITPNDTPFEAGLGWTVKLSKNIDFIGRAHLEKISKAPLKKKLCCFTLEKKNITLVSRETILRNGKVVGYLTSGGYGFTVDQPIGFGYVRNAEGISEDYLTSGDYELIVAQEKIKANLHLKAVYDPKNTRIFT